MKPSIANWHPWAKFGLWLAALAAGAGLLHGILTLSGWGSFWSQEFRNELVVYVVVGIFALISLERPTLRELGVDLSPGCMKPLLRNWLAGSCRESLW